MQRFKFSKTALNALQHPAGREPKRYIVYDTEVQKLVLAVTAGSKVFYVIKRTGGTVSWIKLGAFPELTVEAARKQAETIMGELVIGVNRQEAKRLLRKELTFSSVFEEFLVNKRKRRGTPLGDKTKRDYSDLVRMYLADLHKVKLSEITRSSLKLLHTMITRKSPAQADKCMALISSVFTYALDKEIFTGINPASRIQKNEAISRDRFVTAGELPHILAAILQSSQRDFFLLSLFTGARRSNVQSMAWRDLDLQGGVWRIPLTKNGDPQNVPLGEEAVAILHDRKEVANSNYRDERVQDDGRNAFVFPGAGKTKHFVEPKTAWAIIIRRASLSRLLDAMMTAGALSKVERDEADARALARLHSAELTYHAKATRAGINPLAHAIEDLRLHDLRRTLGSWQAINNSSLAIIGKSLGHKTHQATAIYARLSLDPIRQSVVTATASMLNAAGLKQGADVIPIRRAKKMVSA